MRGVVTSNTDTKIGQSGVGGLMVEWHGQCYGQYWTIGHVTHNYHPNSQDMNGKLKIK